MLHGAAAGKGSREAEADLQEMGAGFRRSSGGTTDDLRFSPSCTRASRSPTCRFKDRWPIRRRNYDRPMGRADRSWCASWRWIRRLLRRPGRLARRSAEDARRARSLQSPLGSGEQYDHGLISRAIGLQPCPVGDAGVVRIDGPQYQGACLLLRCDASLLARPRPI